MKLPLSLPLLLLVPGYLILRVSRRGAPPAARLFRRGWLQALTASIAATSWTGLVLLECGRFSLSNLLLALGGLSSLLLLIFRPPLRGNSRNPHRADSSPPREKGETRSASIPDPGFPPRGWGTGRRDETANAPCGAGGEARGQGALRTYLPLAAVLLAFAGACLWAGSSEYVFAGWDSGEYVNMGASFAEKGRIVYRDAFFASIPPSERSLFTEGGRRYMGFNLLGPEGATVSPKFMHLYPLWLALAMKLSGLRLALSLNVAFTLVSIALCWRTALAMGGRGAAFAAAAFMASSGIELWFSRSQCAEPIAQLFFLGAALFWVQWRQGRGPLYAPLSAACLGMMFLAKFDTLLLLPLSCAALLMTERRRGEGAFLLVLLAALAHLSIHMAWWDRPYAAAILANLPPPLRGRGALLLPAGLAGAVALVPLVRMSGSRGWSPARLPFAARCVAGGAALALASALPFSRGAGNLALLGAVMGAGLLCWGIAALVRIWCGGMRDDAALPWCAAAGALAVFSLSLVGERGLYPWSARRFLPAAAPALFLFSGCFAAEVAGLAARRWRTLLVAALAAMAIAPLAKFPFLLAARDYPGAAAFLPRLAAATEGFDILVVEQTKLAVPLDFLCRRRVLLLKDTEQTAAKCARVEALVAGWLAAGRRVAYATSGPPIFGKSVSFAERASCRLETSVLPPARGGMPRGAAPVAVAVRVLEASPVGAERPMSETIYDVGYNAFGLEEGLSGPRRACTSGSPGRWTTGHAALILPWAGGAAGAVVVTASAGGGDAVRVEVRIGGEKIGAFAVRGPRRNYALLFPPGILPGKRRARVELLSERGIFLERVAIRTER